MSVRLPWQTQSSVISAGFKPSPETHTAVMVHGRKKKRWGEACGALQHVLFMYNDGSRQPMSGDIVSIHTQRLCGGSGTNVSKLQ